MHKNKKSILLVGGSGYLGTHLRNFLSSYKVFFTSTTGKDNSIQLNLMDKRSYKNIKAQNYDYILIIASTLKGLGTRELKEEYIRLDTIGISEFLQFISDEKLTEKIMYTSSMTVYGVDNSIPVKEHGKLNPLSTYGLSKLLGEEIFNFFCNSGSVHGAILRIPGIYGGNRTVGYIYNTALKCSRNENIKLNSSTLGYWEAIHIEDLCIYIKDFIENYDWKAKADTFNIGYGTKTDFIECAYLIKEILNSTSEISIEGEKGYMDFYMDNTRVKEYISIENTFRNSVENYLKNIHL